jgi:penicillin-binding protein 2
LVLCGLVFAALFLRLFQLQIAEGKKMAELAERNAAKIFLEPAPRGVLFDRFGKAIVVNRPIFYVQLLPHILANKSLTDREKILSQLNALLNENIRLGTAATEPIIIKDNIPFGTALRIEEKKAELPGVVVSTRAMRLYPYGSSASHVLGYIREIGDRELARLKNEGYRVGDLIGKDGIEKQYDKLIRGVDGGKKIEVDVFGNPKRILADIEPVPGADVTLTLDVQMQAAVEKILGGREGAVVVMDVKTGEILSLASHPNYDPNIFVKPLEQWVWDRLENTGHPFINRALAVYPPGSIFKVVTLTAALQEGLTRPDEVINCPGYYKIKDRIAKCWLGTGHGPITVMEGLVWSCDVVFFELGRRLGPDQLAKYARLFGLGEKTEIDLPQEKRGTIPRRDWKQQNLKEPWYDGDSINYGIGQGFVQVTPLQMAVVYAALANGKVVQPFVVKQIKARNGEVLYKGEPQVLRDVPLSLRNLGEIRMALREAVKRGTGILARVEGLPAAGKTGTAENPGKAHAWFVCYAPDDAPEIVIVAFVAHGEHGDRVTAAIAHDVLDWYRQNRLKKIYPAENISGQYIWRGGQKIMYGRSAVSAPPEE